MRIIDLDQGPSSHTKDVRLVFNITVGSPQISVVIPVHQQRASLNHIRHALRQASARIQTIIVLNSPLLSNTIKSTRPHEQIVIAHRKGRGYAFLEGISSVQGDITFLLHSDTIPTTGWDQAILQGLRDNEVVGGEFSIVYDDPKPHLRVAVKLVDLWYRVSGELYGDRGIFIRSHILRKCLSALDVPLFEDVRLSKCMHRYGKVLKLPNPIIHSTQDFLQYGFLRNIRRFLSCRIWYALGGTPKRLYQAYYRK